MGTGRIKLLGLGLLLLAAMLPDQTNANVAKCNKATANPKGPRKQTPDDCAAPDNHCCILEGPKQGCAAKKDCDKTQKKCTKEKTAVCKEEDATKAGPKPNPQPTLKCKLESNTEVDCAASDLCCLLTAPKGCGVKAKCDKAKPWEKCTPGAGTNLCDTKDEARPDWSCAATPAQGQTAVRALECAAGKQCCDLTANVCADKAVCDGIADKAKKCSFDGKEKPKKTTLCAVKDLLWFKCDASKGLSHTWARVQNQGAQNSKEWQQVPVIID
jgi:hypothetical protein